MALYPRIPTTIVVLVRVESGTADRLDIAGQAVNLHYNGSDSIVRRAERSIEPIDGRMLEDHITNNRIVGNRFVMTRAALKPWITPIHAVCFILSELNDICSAKSDPCSEKLRKGAQSLFCGYMDYCLSRGPPEAWSGISIISIFGLRSVAL